MSRSSAYNPGARGEYADSPSDIPPRGWRDVLFRVKDEISGDNLSVVAAGVAFYSLLAVFPALAALVMIYGLFADPADVQRQLEPLKDVIPPDAFSILDGQLSAVASKGTQPLGLGLIFTLGLSLWSATAGVKALFTAMNIAYEERETRNFLKFNAVALLFTILGLGFVLVALGVIAAVPAAVDFLGVEGWPRTGLLLLRWVGLAVFVMIALALLFRYGPSRAAARFRWITPGAVVATILWVVGSVAFSFYVQNFASYNRTFGSLGAVVVLLMWFYLTAFIVCLGAELNAELEHQTARDSTTGRERPLGNRGAYVADHAAGTDA
ncbi:MAG TPA: YihY/virulence factor BrkB family protein [Rhodospirillales bacterium]|jgi:membrane protein|nr:YihY/virulence factor BrkB family protein [Rhodospirillales bacterium]